MEKPKITVIVPVYKVEKYLSKCIDSILAQTYTDFELILIDDGSPDNSGVICDEYASRDSRIRVIHKSNGGVSSARNAGIDAAQGEWIAFVDADDWIEPDYLNSMFVGTDDVDLVMQGYKVVKYDATNIRIHRFESERASEDIPSVLSEAEYKNIINSPISKLFKLKIIKDNNIKFESSISYGEDHVFVLEYLQYVKKIFISDSFGYNYFQDDSLSLTRRKISTEKLISYMFMVYEKQNKILQNYDSLCSHKMLKVVAWRFYGVYTKLLYDLFSNVPKYDCYKNIIVELSKVNLTKSSLNTKRKWIFRIIENSSPKISYQILKLLLPK